LRRRLTAIVAAHGPRSVALLGSPRAGMEANLLLRDLADDLGTPHLVFNPRADHDQAARTIVSRLDRHAVSLAEVRRSDLMVVVGTDSLQDGPLLALALRQAVRAGGQVVVIAPQPPQLPCRFMHLPCPAEQFDAALKCLSDGTPGDLESLLHGELAKLRQQLTGAQRPVLIGSQALGSAVLNRLFDAAASLSNHERSAGVMNLLSEANSYGVALLASDGPDFDMLLEAVQQGEIRALVCLEANPFGESREPARSEAALARLERLAVLDSLPTGAAGRADIFLPTCTSIETDGCYINNEGRLQAFSQVMEPGLPLRETSPDVHPPREFFKETPGSAPWPAWRILARLLGREESLPGLRRELAGNDSRFAPLAEVAPGGGVRLTTGEESPGEAQG